MRQRQSLYELKLVPTREPADGRTGTLSVTVVLLLFCFIFEAFGRLRPSIKQYGPSLLVTYARNTQKMGAQKGDTFTDDKDFIGATPLPLLVGRLGDRVLRGSSLMSEMTQRNPSKKGGAVIVKTQNCSALIPLVRPPF